MHAHYTDLNRAEHDEKLPQAEDMNPSQLLTLSACVSLRVFFAFGILIETTDIGS